MCECHDDEETHEREQAEEMAYWRAYFGNAVRIQGEIDRLLRADGIDPTDQHQIQERLKR